MEGMGGVVETLLTACYSPAIIYTCLSHSDPEVLVSNSDLVIVFQTSSILSFLDARFHDTFAAQSLISEMIHESRKKILSFLVLGHLRLAHEAKLYMFSRETSSSDN